MTSTQKYDFTGKVALITGSSSGMGAAIAIKLAQYGANVTITGRNAENLEKIAQKIEQISSRKPLQIIGDLADLSLPQKLITETIAKFGKLSFLVNNAGYGSPNDMVEHPEFIETFDQVMNVNLRTTVVLTHLAVPYLVKTKGSIVNISGTASMQPYRPILSTSKAALDMFTKTSAGELAAKGVRVNAINPGLVATRIGRCFGMENYFQLFEEQIKSSIPLNRIAQPDDIANLAAFLLSEDAQNMTGSCVVSDGGRMVKAIE